MNDTIDCDHPSTRPPSSVCESSAASRKITTNAARSTRASAARRGAESHSQAGAIWVASRDARTHTEHNESGLYRDSTVTRHARQTRPSAFALPIPGSSPASPPLIHPSAKG